MTVSEPIKSEPTSTTNDVEAVAKAARPQLLFFYSRTSGAARRVEGYLAQVLTRRKNHDTFVLRRIDFDARPQLAEHFGITAAPTLVVLEGTQVQARVENPTGAGAIRTMLTPWLK